MASFLSINSGGPSPYFKRGTRQNENSLVTALERLSTGVRVNSAGDDAAALSINNRLTAQLIGARTAIRNIADGASLLQTIESALGESTVALLRARELASRASNDYLNGNDVEALKAEFDELMSHVDSISEQTTFNGIKVLDGEHHEELSLQVGELVGDTVKLGPMKANTDSLGRQARYTSARRGAFIGDLEEGQVMINGVAIRATTESDDELSYSYASGSALAKVNAINQASPYTGVRAIAGPTVIEGFEPIRKLTLDEGRYFKINGHAISGFSFEDKDATGSLVQNINAAYEHTMVKAQLTADGRINLIAEDGRNVTIEYRGSSDENAAQVRDSLRIIDSFGDPINLAGTVDPVETILDGDISGPITFKGPSGFTGGFDIIADAKNNVGTTVDAAVIPTDQGGFKYPRDHVDYILEVVEPGQLGTATFRFKEEPLANYTADTDLFSEDYDNHRWTPRGAYSDNTGKFSEASSSFYNEASNRQYVLTVTQSGSPTAPTSSGLPKFTYSILNKDTGITEATGLLGNGGAGVDTSDLTLKHNVVLDINTNINFTSKGVGISAGQAMRETVSKSQGYTDDPRFISWTGSKITDYTITVEDSGHFTYSTPLSGSQTSAATLRVIGIDRETGNEVTNEKVTLNSGAGPTGHTITVDGLKFKMNPQNVSPGIGLNMNGSTFGTNPSYIKSTNSVYTGQSNRNYEVTFNQTGRLSNTSGLNATVKVTQGGSTLHTYNTTITSGDTRLAGGTAFDEGVVLTLGQSGTQQSLSHTSGVYAPTSLAGSYSGTTNDKVIFKITDAGVVGVAKYAYYYESDPSTVITGTVTDTTSIGSGLSLKFGDATEELKTNDVWQVTLDADVINAGAKITLQPKTRNLTSGHQWQFTAEPPEWLVGDQYTIDVDHNFTDWEQPLNSVVSLPNVGDFEITGAGSHSFETGDEIRVHTRGFTGSAVSGGTYGDNLYPTYYKIVITQPGEIGTAKFTWAREDGRQDLTQNPEIYGFNSDVNGPIGGTGEQTVFADGNTLESGVTIQWFNNSSSIPSYLSVGDTFRIPVGQKLEYTFGGTITLQSEDEIHLEYSDASIDNQLGRFLFQGAEEDNDIAGDEQSVSEGILGVNEDRSLNDLSLDSRWAAEEAVDTLDLAVDQLSGMRTMIGALLNTLESNTRSTEERILNLAAASSRLVDADVAAETAELTRVQIVRTLNPQLAQTERLSAMKTLDLVRLNSII